MFVFIIRYTNIKKCLPNTQQIVGENPDKDKIVAEYQKRLHRSLNSKNVGLYVKAFMKYDNNTG